MHGYSYSWYVFFFFEQRSYCSCTNTRTLCNATNKLLGLVYEQPPLDSTFQDDIASIQSVWRPDTQNSSLCTLYGDLDALPDSLRWPSLNTLGSCPDGLPRSNALNMASLFNLGRILISQTDLCIEAGRTQELITNIMGDLPYIFISMRLPFKQHHLAKDYLKGCRRPLYYGSRWSVLPYVVSLRLRCDATSPGY